MNGFFASEQAFDGFRDGDNDLMSQCIIDEVVYDPTSLALGVRFVQSQREKTGTEM